MYKIFIFLFLFILNFKALSQERPIFQEEIIYLTKDISTGKPILPNKIVIVDKHNNCGIDSFYYYYNEVRDFGVFKFFHDTTLIYITYRPYKPGYYYLNNQHSSNTFLEFSNEFFLSENDYNKSYCIKNLIKKYMLDEINYYIEDSYCVNVNPYMAWFNLYYNRSNLVRRKGLTNNYHLYANNYIKFAKLIHFNKLEYMHIDRIKNTYCCFDTISFQELGFKSKTFNMNVFRNIPLEIPQIEIVSDSIDTPMHCEINILNNYVDYFRTQSCIIKIDSTKSFFMDNSSLAVIKQDSIKFLYIYPLVHRERRSSCPSATYPKIYYLGKGSDIYTFAIGKLHSQCHYLKDKFDNESYDSSNIFKIYNEPITIIYYNSKSDVAIEITESTSILNCKSVSIQDFIRIKNKEPKPNYSYLRNLFNPMIDIQLNRHSSEIDENVRKFLQKFNDYY
jgi:hypothetical protein